MTIGELKKRIKGLDDNIVVKISMKTYDDNVDRERDIVIQDISSIDIEAILDFDGHLIIRSNEEFPIG